MSFGLRWITEVEGAVELIQHVDAEEIEGDEVD